MSTAGDLQLATRLLLGSIGSTLSNEEADAIKQAFVKAVSQSKGYTSNFLADFETYQMLFDGRHFYDSPTEVSKKEPSVVVLNELGNHIRYLAAWLTDRVPRLRVFPASDDTPEEAAILIKRVLTSYFVAYRMKLALKRAYEDALCFGAGFARFYWDPFEEGGKGALKCEAVPPYDVMPGPGMDDIRDGPYFVVRRLVEPRAAEEARSKRLEADTSFADNDYDWRSARAVGGVRVGQYTTVETTPFFTTQTKDAPLQQKPSTELKEVYDIWCRLRDVYGQRWVKITTDLEFIYTPIEIHAELPFAHYRFQPLRSRRFYGQGLAELLYYPQRVIDQISSMINRQIHFTADPIWVEEAGARDTGRPGEHRIKAGQVIFVQDGYKGRVGFEHPPPLQDAQFAMIQLMLSYFERVTGMSAYMRGMTPPRRELVGVVEQIAEASQVLVRTAAEEFEHQTEAALTAAADIVASQLTEGGRIYLMEDESPDRSIDLPPYPFYVGNRPEGGPMHFKVHFEAGTSMAISRSERSMQAFRFYQATNGIMGPEWLARELGIDGAAEVVAEAIGKQQEKEQQMLAVVQAAAREIAEAAQKLLKGEDNARDQERGSREAQGYAVEENQESQGFDGREGRTLPDRLGSTLERLAYAAAGSPEPSPGPVSSGSGFPPGGNAPA